MAQKHDIPVKDILSDRRARVLIPARHEAIWRCVAETPLSLPAIGRVFHRDHTSIGHAVMRHHLTTGAPLPRGMDWQAGRRKRRPGKEAQAALGASEGPGVPPASVGPREHLASIPPEPLAEAALYPVPMAGRHVTPGRADAAR